MSLAEIKDAVTDLTPDELAELAAFIQTQDKAAEKTDAAAPQEDWPEFPVFDGGPLDGALQHDKYIFDEPGFVCGEDAQK